MKTETESTIRDILESQNKINQGSGFELTAADLEELIIAEVEFQEGLGKGVKEIHMGLLKEGLEIAKKYPWQNGLPAQLPADIVKYKRAQKKFYAQYCYS